jgi:hypothetical protein
MIGTGAPWAPKYCVETKSPVILQVSSGARKYANQTLLRYMAQGAVEYAKELGYAIPIVLHLDHGDTFELCKNCIDFGFSSVMIDGSHLPYAENVALTKKVVEYAHKHDVSVEGELGVLSGIEDEVSHEQTHYTKPEEVEDFVKKTGVDSLAISIGTSHGAYKFKPEQCTKDENGVLVPPPLRFDILEEIERRIPGFPIVLHPRDPDVAWVFPMDGSSVWPRTSPDGKPASYVTRDAGAECAALREYQATAGGVPSPFDCWLVLRSLPTLPLRVRAQAANALAVARFLHADKRVEQVHYAGLPDHPGHEIALRQMTGGFGGVLV